MKKFLVAFTIIVILRIGSLIYFDTKLIEEPIVVAAVYDEGLGMLNIGYITNRLMAVDLQHFEYDGRAYYAEIFSEEGPGIRAQPYREYQYHSLYSATMLVREPGEESDLTEPGEGRVYFSDGTSQTVTFNVTPEADSEFLHMAMSSGGTEGHKGLYIAKKDFELQEVVWDGRIKDATLTLNRNPIELPISIPTSVTKGDRIEIKSTGGLARFLGDTGYLFFRGIDSRGVVIELPIIVNINEGPSNEWIEQYVEERDQ